MKYKIQAIQDTHSETSASRQFTEHQVPLPTSDPGFTAFWEWASAGVTTF